MLGVLEEAPKFGLIRSGQCLMLASFCIVEVAGGGVSWGKKEKARAAGVSDEGKEALGIWRRRGETRRGVRWRGRVEVWCSSSVTLAAHDGEMGISPGSKVKRCGEVQSKQERAKVRSKLAPLLRAAPGLGSILPASQPWDNWITAEHAHARHVPTRYLHQKTSRTIFIMLPCIINSTRVVDKQAE